MSSLNHDFSSPSTRNTSSPSDLVLPYPSKKSRPNSRKEHDSRISGLKPNSGITQDYLDKLFQSRPKRYFEDVAKLPADVLRAFDPIVYCPETLPKGYVWCSYMGGIDIKKHACLMFCGNCGQSGDHMIDKCPHKGSQEEFMKRIGWEA